MIDPAKVAQKAAEYTEAWNSKSPAAVASHYAETGRIVINAGDPWDGHAKIEEMAAGFYADVPDLTLTCDDIRCSGSHAIFVWSFTGHDATTGAPLLVKGWEEWDLNEQLQVQASRGWYDAEDYERQVAGG